VNAAFSLSEIPVAKPAASEYAYHGCFFKLVFGWEEGHFSMGDYVYAAVLPDNFRSGGTKFESKIRS